MNATSHAARYSALVCFSSLAHEMEWSSGGDGSAATVLAQPSRSNASWCG